MRSISSESAILLLPTLATKIGLNEAIVLQQTHYWLDIYESNKEKHGKLHFKDDRFWIYNSYESWQLQFPFWSTSTIRRIFSNLEDMGLIITGNYNNYKGDKTKWYTIDYDKVREQYGENEELDKDNSVDSSTEGQNNTTETEESSATEIVGELPENIDVENILETTINPEAGNTSPSAQNELAITSTWTEEDSKMSSDTCQFEQSNTIRLPPNTITDIMVSSSLDKEALKSSNMKAGLLNHRKNTEDIPSSYRKNTARGFVVPMEMEDEIPEGVILNHSKNIGEHAIVLMEEKIPEDVLSCYKENITEKAVVSANESRILEKWLRIFSAAIVKKAIEHTALSSTKNGLSYMVALLMDWKRQGLFSLPEVERYLEKRNEKLEQGSFRTGNSCLSKAAERNYSRNKASAFCDYPQREYDFAELESRLLGW